MEYKLTDADIDNCVKFAVNIYKSGPQTNRTTGESRGLGKSIDDWASGKASEIAVRGMLEQAGSKKLELDFDIYNRGQHADKPDIIKVLDDSKSVSRDPNLWVEVKSVKCSNRWIGLSMEQVKTISNSNADSDVFLVYTTSINPSTGSASDIMGAFLSRALKRKYNAISTGVSSGFSIWILAVLTLEDLKKIGTVFIPQRDYVVETDIFKEVDRTPKNLVEETFDGGRILDVVQGGSDYHDNLRDLCAPRGSLKIYHRDNKKSRSYYVLALQDLDLRSRVLGCYRLKKDGWYRLRIGRAGRNPSVYNDVLWTAFRNVRQMFGSEDNINAFLKRIMEGI